MPGGYIASWYAAVTKVPKVKFVLWFGPGVQSGPQGLVPRDKLLAFMDFIGGCYGPIAI